jgi:Zn-dependent peptidase ImmA (M78 family)/DNA-binding XRE family transcriptional regulator
MLQDRERIVMAEALPFNRKVLRWARERRAITIADAANRVGVKPDALEAWETESGPLPTVRQGRILADLYRRSFLEFFRDELPPDDKPKLIPDFRLHRQTREPPQTLELRDLQVWAEEIRLNALDLYEILNEEVPSVLSNTRAALSDSPEEAADRARKAIGFSLKEQRGLKAVEREALPSVFRRKLEGAGMLVLRSSELKNVGARGLCIAERPLPIIIFGHEAASAQMFTLAHELGHVVLGESAISGPPGVADSATYAAKVERWCNQFAAAFLVPASALSHIRLVPNYPAPKFDDASLGDLARTFGVSRHAMLLRLIDLGYVEAAYYRNEKRAQFLAQEGKLKSGGHTEYYGSRYRSAHGDLYTSLVLGAWGANLITNHNAAELMGSKSISHVEDIRRHFV